MQWDTSAHAGFTAVEAKPWMTANPNYKEINAADQTARQDSVHSCWKTILGLRKKYKDVFVYGDFDLIDEDNLSLVAYKRTSAAGEVAVVVCNFTAGRVSFDGMPDGPSEVLVSTGSDGSLVDQVILGPYDAMVVLQTQTGTNT